MHPCAQRPTLCRFLGHRDVLDCPQRCLRAVDCRMDAPQRESRCGGAQVGWITPEQRGGSKRHAAPLPEKAEVARDHRGVERRSGDRAVDPGQPRRLAPQLLGDLRRRGVGAALPGRLRPLERRRTKPFHRMQRQPLSDMLRIAIHNSRQPACVGEPAPDMGEAAHRLINSRCSDLAVPRSAVMFSSFDMLTPDVLNVLTPDLSSRRAEGRRSQPTPRPRPGLLLQASCRCVERGSSPLDADA